MNDWSERQLRDHLWRERENWGELIDPHPEGLNQPGAFDAVKVCPEDLCWELIRRRLVDDLEDVRELTLVGREVPISSPQRSTMFMDLFGIPYALGAPGLAVIELKVGGRTSRESFTELLGYSQGLCLRFPAMCRDDLIHVLVAPMSRAPAIVRHAVCGSMLFDKRRIVVLEPLFDNPVQGSVRLRPWIPSRDEAGLLGRLAFAEKNFILETQVWADDPGWWHETAMNGVTLRSALAMESKGIHGFTFSATAWPELPFPYPNSLVCVGLNPYQIANDIVLARHGVLSVEALSASAARTTLCDLLPGLAKGPECDDILGLADAAAVWESHICGIAYDVVQQAVRRRDGAPVATDRGTLPWNEYLRDSIESVFRTSHALAPTGLIRELYDLVVDIDYELLAKDGEHPLHGDAYLYAEEARRSHFFFREFLLRMLRPGGSLSEELFEDEQNHHDE